MAEALPGWLEGLSHKDFLFNGSTCTEDAWARLDWHRAYVDMGPSPAGNAGPYWHVPRPCDETIQRLYPKVLRSKWLLLIRRAVEEAIERDRRPAAAPRTPAPRNNLSAAILQVFANNRGLRLNSATVIAQLRRSHRGVSVRQINNALDYLKRTGRLIRVERGRYEAANG